MFQKRCKFSFKKMYGLPTDRVIDCAIPAVQEYQSDIKNQWAKACGHYYDNWKGSCEVHIYITLKQRADRVHADDALDYFTLIEDALKGAAYSEEADVHITRRVMSEQSPSLTRDKFEAVIYYEEGK